MPLRYQHGYLCCVKRKVGVYWIAHHHMLHFVTQVNRRLLWLNLAVPLLVLGY